MPDRHAGRGNGGGELLLEARAIVKTFGALVANDQVDLKVAPGEIHALLGENGAGKSTLVKMLYGSLQPDAGEIRWKGQAAAIGSPAAARRLGIGMVFQHFSLFEALTVVDNIALALPKDAWAADLPEKVRSVSASYGLPLDPLARVADLSVGERQRIEIVRCLLQEPELIIMDEPTSVLTPQEADQLFVTLERLASEGCAVLYICHRLEEVKRLCQAATILRHGKVVAHCDPADETAGSLARMMVGSEIHEVQTKANGAASGTARLSIKALSVPAPGPFAIALREVALEARGGEIIGIAGVAGNGQDELFDALSGETLAAAADAVSIDGEACGQKGPAERRRRGAAFVPEERLGHGSVPHFRLSENVVLTRFNTADGLVKAGFVNLSVAKRLERQLAATYDIRMAHPDSEARALSGGNLQKFVVGREIDSKPNVLVVSQPTWGVDAGAAATIRQALIDLARGGSAVVVISQDLDEILEISDRIAVISKGGLSEAVPSAETDREAIGLLMGGVGDH